MEHAYLDSRILRRINTNNNRKTNIYIYINIYIFRVRYTRHTSTHIQTILQTIIQTKTTKNRKGKKRNENNIINHASSRYVIPIKSL